MTGKYTRHKIIISILMLLLIITGTGFYVSAEETTEEPDIFNYVSIHFNVKADGPGEVQVDGFTTRNDNDSFPVESGDRKNIHIQADKNSVIKSATLNGKSVTKQVSKLRSLSIKSNSQTLVVKFERLKQIVPRLKSKKKAIKVTYKAKNKGVKYQVQYSNNKKMKKAKVKVARKTSYTVKGLSKKKKYYIRVRSYKTVSGKKYYSKWSKIKRGKTK